jgi:hypothetical protein
MFKWIKGALKSNTVQFNGAAAILWFLEVLGQTNFISDDSQYSALLAGIVALVNIVLRFKTKKALPER